MRKVFSWLAAALSISFQVFGTADVPLYLWTTNSVGASMNATQLLPKGRARSITISSNSSLYMAGSSSVASTLFPSLMIANLDGSSLNTIELTNNGTSFATGSGYGIATNSGVYIAGTADDPAIPYLWTANLDGSNVRAIELTNNGSSFTTGLALDIALSPNLSAYIVGTADEVPYLWVANQTGSAIQTIELTNNGVSFSTGSGSGVAISSSGQVYIVGNGDSLPYLWIVNLDGSSIQAIELTNNGSSFSSGSSSRIALSSDEKLYMVGYGTGSCATKPYLWIRDPSGSVQSSALTNNGQSFSFGMGLDVAVSIDDVTYIVGYGVNSPVASYLWVRSANGSINTIQLVDNSGAAVGTAGAITLYYPGSGSNDLISTLRKYANVHIMQGNSSGITVDAPIVYIVSGAPPVG